MPWSGVHTANGSFATQRPPHVTLLIFCAGIVATSRAQTPEMIRKVELATAAERAAIELNPTSAEAYRALADAYRGQRFLRAAAGALSNAVALTPQDEAGQLELGALLRRVGDPSGATKAFNAALKLRPSADAHVHLSYLAPEAVERERHARTALHLSPNSAAVYHRLAQLFGEDKSRPPRTAEADAAWRGMVDLDPVFGGRQFFDHLRFSNRKLEASIAFRGAKVLATERAEEAAAVARAAEVLTDEPRSDGLASASPPSSAGKSASHLTARAKPSELPLTGSLADWLRYVDDIEASAHSFPPKCLERSCIEGLQEALATAKKGPRVAEVPADSLDVRAVHEMLKAPVPTVLRAATVGWGPTTRWDAGYLAHASGEEEVEVTVVTTRGAFEVRADRIERPPKSVMRLGDYMRWLSLKRDFNLTLYSRQAPLWPMTGLLADLEPLPWMETLRLNDLNFWLGDGHYRNTLHFDPYDNLLCQLRGRKHVLLYPPDAKSNLYYAARRDIQASYTPGRGEYGRRDTGIVSHNTAEINGAAPDLEAHPNFRKALEAQVAAGAICKQARGAPRACAFAILSLTHKRLPITSLPVCKPASCAELRHARAIRLPVLAQGLASPRLLGGGLRRRVQPRAQSMDQPREDALRCAPANGARQCRDTPNPADVDG